MADWVRKAAALLIGWLSLASFAWAAEPRPDLGLLEAATLRAAPTGWVVLDARPKAEWLAGHIPGARSFSWEDYTRTDSRGVPYKIWPAQELAGVLGAMGIDERTPVVVYGDADKSWGGEGWACWALAWLGHRGPIRMLAGGVQAWRRLGVPLTAGQERTAPRPARYQARPRPELDIDTGELRRSTENCSIVDTRSALEWVGGRVPGAVHIPWNDFYAGPDRRPLGPEAVRKLLETNGVDLSKPVVYYCAGGIRSAYVWTVHQLSALPAARNYEGGIEEWKRIP